jgi:hypothetical protein
MRRSITRSSHRTTLRLVGTGEGESGSALLVPLDQLRVRFDNYAKNQQGSSAYGIAQLLREKDSRAEFQILRGLKYIKVRYQSPCRAYKFFLQHRYY